MGSLPSQGSVLRFGVYELDLRSGELLKAGTRIRLQPQPFKVLTMLASHAGQVVTREEIQQQIWGNDTFVDFEKGLNFCVKQVRAVLGDDADKPRYIETIPRRGYRFMPPVEQGGHAGEAGAEVSPLRRPEGPAPASEEAATVPVQRAGALPQRLAWLLVLATAALTLAAALTLNRLRRPSLPFKERDWVLISSFENRTGEPVFDGTLEYALERAISNSTFVNVVPRERINDALQLMKKPPNTPIDAASGREICLRDGGIRALLTGRVEKLDTTYLLSATLVNPTNGVAVATITEKAVGQHEVLPALLRLSDRVREKLGEDLPLIARSDQALEKVATPSLRALQLYSHAMGFFNEHKAEHTAELLDEAIKDDPQFASAQILLALCYSHLGREGEASPHYQKAFALADTTTGRERYYLLANYYRRSRNGWEKAAEAYEVLLRLYPDDYWASSELSTLLQHMGRLNEALPYVLRAADLRPNDYQANAAAMLGLAGASRPNLPSLEPYLRRTEKLATGDAGKSGWLLSIRAYRSWLRGDIAEAQGQMARLTEIADSTGGTDRDRLLNHLGYWYLTLGKPKAANETFQSIRDPQLRYEGLVQVDLVRGDEQALGEHLHLSFVSSKGAILPPDVILLFRTGHVADAQKWITALKKEQYPDSVLKTVQGELALARGRHQEAIAFLRESVEETRNFAGRVYFLGSESLASALEKQGDWVSAARVLERASQWKWTVVTFQIVGPAWLRSEWRRAQLYRKAGRQQEAKGVEAELLKLLTYADPDFPMLVELKREMAQGEASNRKSGNAPAFSQ